MNEYGANDRGVSDLLGYALVFSLIITSVGVVSVAGVGSLEDARTAEQENNAERAFDVLANNLADIHRFDAPGRTTELKLGGAELGHGDKTTVTVELTDVTGTPTYNVKANPLVYESPDGETQLAYEFGAVVRSDPGGAVMKQRPPFLFTDTGGTTTAVLSLVQTRATGTGSVGGYSVALIRADRSVAETLGTWSTPTADTGDSTYDVSLTIQTDSRRASTWHRYLEPRIEAAVGVSDPCTVSGDTVVCSFSAERVHVSVTRIDVSIGG